MSEWRATEQIIPLDETIKFKPVKGTLWVEELDIGGYKVGSIEVPSDWKINSTRLSAQGIHPRWAKVFAVADNLKELFEIGDMIYIQHGHWTQNFKFLINGKIKMLWMIPKKNVLEGVIAIKKANYEKESEK